MDHRCTCKTKLKTIKNLEYIVGEIMGDHGFDNDLLNTAPKAWSMKLKKKKKWEVGTH